MGGGKFDFKEVDRLRKQINQIEKEREQFCEACAKELADRLLARVGKRTPTGKKPACLTKAPKVVKVKGSSGKSRTFLSKESAILKKYWAGYSGGTLKHGWTVGEIKKTGGNYTVEVINPTEYASYVEYGHRQTPGRYIPALGKKAKAAWVPGKLMLTISERQLQGLAPAIVEKKLENWLKGVIHA